MHIKISIPKNLSIRAKRLCSEQDDFNKYITKLNTAFDNWGYPPKLLKNQMNKNKNHTNNQL